MRNKKTIVSEYKKKINILKNTINITMMMIIQKFLTQNLIN